MRKIKKGDDVIVISGKDKGQRGKVMKIIKANQRIVVEGINIIKKHMKPNPQKQQVGGIVDRESPIALSNVALYNSVTKKADKVGMKLLEDGRKVRYFKSNNELVDI